jgi:hypothetical protein
MSVRSNSKKLATTSLAAHSLFFWTRCDIAVQSRASNRQSFAVLLAWWRRCAEAYFGQPPKCEVAHTSLPIRPSKVRHSDIYPEPGGYRGTETKTKTS